MPNKNNQQTLPYVKIPFPLPAWLKGYTRLQQQAKILNNGAQYKKAILLAKADFKNNPSAITLGIICTSYMGLEDKKGFENTLKKWEELNDSSALLNFNKAIYNLFFMEDIKKYKFYLDKAEQQLQDLPDDNKAQLLLMKTFSAKNKEENISYLDNALTYKETISPQTLALAYYYKALAYIYGNQHQKAYEYAHLSVKAAQDCWEGHYARALAGCIIHNFKHFAQDTDFVIKHTQAGKEVKIQMKNLQNAFTEKLLHPHNAKVSLDENFYTKLKEIYIKSHENFAAEFLTVKTFVQAEKIFCIEHLKILFRQSIKSGFDFACQYIKPILNDKLQADLNTLQTDLQTHKQEKLLPLFKTAQELVRGLKNIMNEDIWAKKGQMIIMHSIMGLTISDEFSSNLPNLKYLENAQKANLHIQKLRAVIEQINKEYFLLYYKFMCEFTILAAQYNADISIPDKK